MSYHQLTRAQKYIVLDRLVDIGKTIDPKQCFQYKDFTITNTESLLSKLVQDPIVRALLTLDYMTYKLYRDGNWLSGVRDILGPQLESWSVYLFRATTRITEQEIYGTDDRRIFLFRLSLLYRDLDRGQPCYQYPILHLITQADQHADVLKRWVDHWLDEDKIYLTWQSEIE